MLRKLLLFCLIIIFFTLSCEKLNISDKNKTYLEYLSDKSINSIEIYDQIVWILSSKVCETCDAPPYISSLPSIRQLTLIESETYKYEEPFNFNIPIKDSKGNLYIATNNTIYQFNKIGDYTEILNTGDFYFNAFTFDENDNIWLSGYDGIAFWDKANLTIYNSENSDLPSNITHGLVIDNSGVVWVALDFEGLLQINSNTWEITPNFDIPGLKDNSYLRNPIVDDENNIWFTVCNSDTNSNILEYNGVEWKYHIANQNNYNTLNMDFQGTIWAISDNYENNEYYEFINSSLSYYQNGEWHQFDINNINYKVTTVNVNEDKVYIGTVNGLFEKNR